MLIYQPIEGYCYNSDSLILYDFIMRFNPKKEVLEIGSGCGIIGLLLKRDRKINLNVVELQEMFARFTKKNAEVNGLELTLYQENFLAFKANKKFDYIVSNPPFYHEDVVQSNNINLNIARYNHHLPLEPFIKQVKQHLNPRGHFIFCYDAKQIQNILTLLQKYKLVAEHIRYVHPSISKKASLVLIQARNNSRSLTQVLPPFISFENEAFSEELQAIYKQTRTHSIKCEIS